MCWSYRADTCACVESVGPVCTRVPSVGLPKTLAFMLTCHLDPPFMETIFSLFFLLMEVFIFFSLETINCKETTRKYFLDKNS